MWIQLSKSVHVHLFTNRKSRCDVTKGIPRIPQCIASRCVFVNGARMQRKGPGRFFGKKGKSGKGKGGEKGSESVHRTNFRLAAVPLIFFFNILRILAFQLWVLLSLVCRVSAHALPNKSKHTGGDKPQDKNSPESLAEMAQSTPSKASPVGPGEPALAKQKHHHRKAFEYISKALKIDEEDKGESFNYLFTIM